MFSNYRIAYTTAILNAPHYFFPQISIHFQFQNKIFSQVSVKAKAVTNGFYFFFPTCKKIVPQSQYRYVTISLVICRHLLLFFPLSFPLMIMLTCLSCKENPHSFNQSDLNAHKFSMLTKNQNCTPLSFFSFSILKIIA